mgnify:CR=1 FL=1
MQVLGNIQIHWTRILCGECNKWLTLDGTRTSAEQAHVYWCHSKRVHGPGYLDLGYHNFTLVSYNIDGNHSSINRYNIY